MESAAVVALALLALATVIQTFALLVVGLAFRRLQRQLKDVQERLAPAGGRTQSALFAAVEDLALASRLAAEQARTARETADHARADIGHAVAVAKQGIDIVAQAAWTVGPLLESLERGVEAYRHASKSTRPFGRALDAGVAAYRAVSERRAPTV